MNQDGTPVNSQTPGFSGPANPQGYQNPFRRQTDSGQNDMVYLDPVPQDDGGRKIPKVFIIAAIAFVAIVLIVVIIAVSMSNSSVSSDEVLKIYNRLGNYVISGEDKTDPLPDEQPRLAETELYRRAYNDEIGYYDILKQITDDADEKIKKTGEEPYQRFTTIKNYVNAIKLSRSFHMPSVEVLEKVRTYEITQKTALTNSYLVPEELSNDYSNRLSSLYYNHAAAYIQYYVASGNCDSNCADENLQQFTEASENYDDARLEYLTTLRNYEEELIKLIFEEAGELAQ